MMWEIDTATTFAVFCLAYLGEMAELARRVPASLREASERGDLYLATNLRPHFPEIATRNVTRFEGELVLRDLRERRGQLVDCVLLHGACGMAAWIRHFNCVVLRKLFGRLHHHQQRLSILIIAPAATLIEGEFRVDQVPRASGQPLGTVECCAGFLTTSQGHL